MYKKIGGLGLLYPKNNAHLYFEASLLRAVLLTPPIYYTIKLGVIICD